ncbi:bile acid:sodium symporter family protein [Amycolatopsis sp. FDAARGOS 1241]|uniref:bile acid:sodium symporter family protein n=1 Tax=Amycolatopsis sp. FDAARGOS 1241 TaxID=2778070 RepID=UPI0019508658|nr:bile acid:sodium symporter family protein [Amycolatopsis sp. FDAARGOS 1241]QRP48667.1 bile acid:sodium symporter [Amycolatopsis sp. FDAARGOS 1241]
MTTVLAPLTRPVSALLAKLRIDPFIAAILCTVGVASLLPASGATATGFGIASNIAVGVLFFLYGARLSSKEALDGLRHWRLHVTVLSATFVLFPLLGLAASFLSPGLLTSPLYTGVLFLCLLPSTVQSSIAFTSIAKGNVAAAICSASVSNLLGIVLTPLLVALLLSTDGPGVSGSAVLDIVLQLLVPFVAGQLARRWIGGWVSRHSAPLKLVDRGSILLVVYTAFSEGMTEGIWHKLDLGPLFVLLGVCVVLLAAVLTATSVGARLLGFDRADRITIVFCGSKKSLASGLPMATVLFGHGQVGLIVLPLMLFHQIQLIVCAAMARRYARHAAASDEDTDEQGELVPAG